MNGMVHNTLSLWCNMYYICINCNHDETQIKDETSFSHSLHSPALYSLLVLQRNGIFGHNLRLRCIVFFIAEISRGRCPEYISTGCHPGTLERFQIFHGFHGNHAIFCKIDPCSRKTHVTQSLFVIKGLYWCQIRAKTCIFLLRYILFKWLICIFMNINENIKNWLKIMKSYI